MTSYKVPQGRTKQPALSTKEIAYCRKYLVKSFPEEWKLVKVSFGVTTADLTTSDAIHWAYEKARVNLQDAVAWYHNPNNPDRENQDETEEKQKEKIEEKEEKEEKEENKSGDDRKAYVEGVIRTLAADAGLPVLVGEEVTQQAKGAFIPPLPKASGVQHSAFPVFLQACQASKATGGAFSVMLVGPKATGKTQACRNAAKSLGVDFYLQSTAIEDFQLIGFVDANGRYHATQFVRAFRDGGLMLLDELDAWSPSALIALNAPLSVGIMALPDGSIIDRHPDFVCVGAANTFGTGADHAYNAREKLDDATLSRFAVKIAWRRDYKVEAALVNNKAWLDECHAVSQIMIANDLPDQADLRAILAGEALLHAGMDIQAVRHATYLAGLSKDQIKMIRDGLADKQRG